MLDLLITILNSQITHVVVFTLAATIFLAYMMIPLDNMIAKNEMQRGKRDLDDDITIHNHYYTAPFLKVFVKDSNVVNMPVYSEPYFSHFLENGGKEWISDFEGFDNCISALGRISGTTDEKRLYKLYKEYNNELMQFVIHHYSPADDQWKKVQNFLISTGYKSPGKQSVYTFENCNHYYVSIDMKQACFTATQLVHQNYLDGMVFSDWLVQLIEEEADLDSIIYQMRNEPFLMTSKKFRQVCFGKMNPKGQRKLEQVITSEIYRRLKQIMHYEILITGSEELIIKVDVKEMLPSVIENCHIYLNKPFHLGDLGEYDLSNSFHIVPYFLKKIETPDNREWFLRLIYSETEFDIPARTDIKKVDNRHYHQVLRYLKGEPSQKNDLVFCVDNSLDELAYFQKSLFDL